MRIFSFTGLLTKLTGTMAQRESREKKLSNSICGSEDTQLEKDIKIAGNKRKRGENEDSSKQMDGGTTSEHDIKRSKNEDDDGTMQCLSSTARDDQQHSQESPVKVSPLLKQQAPQESDISTWWKYVKRVPARERSPVKIISPVLQMDLKEEEYLDMTPAPRRRARRTFTTADDDSEDSEEDEDSSFSEMRNSWIKVKSFDLQGNGSGGKGTTSSSAAAAAAGGTGAQKS